jgi:hypothetical protein
MMPRRKWSNGEQMDRRDHAEITQAFEIEIVDKPGKILHK